MQFTYRLSVDMLNITTGTVAERIWMVGQLLVWWGGGEKQRKIQRGAEGSCFATTPLKSVDTSARITVTKALETATTTVAGSGNVADHQKVQLQKQVESKKKCASTYSATN